MDPMGLRYQLFTLKLKPIRVFNDELLMYSEYTGPFLGPHRIRIRQKCVGPHSCGLPRWLFGC